MSTFLQILFLIVGFALLIKGADVLIAGASSVAQNFKVSKMLIGLTIIAFGTSAPELAVSITALASGSTDLVLGNVIGSNILNVLLLIGIAALIKPIRVKSNTVRKELPICLLISTLLAVLFLDRSLNGEIADLITRGDGVVVLLFFCVFVYYLVNLARQNRKEKNKIEKPKYKLSTSILLTLLGLVGVIAGSDLVVSNASSLATSIGISERIISLTIVAFGTSLPELVTTISAARKGEQDLIVGNIIGSNIFNICLVLGLPVVLFGTVTPGSFQLIDLGMLVFSALILLFFSYTGKHKITRFEGVAMLIIFVIYYSFVISGATI